MHSILIVLFGVSESTDESTSKRPKAYRKLGLYMRADVMIIIVNMATVCVVLRSLNFLC